ncbi:alpha/beta fold hydrolase [Halanaerobium saccharolyticum]|uniref:alpha/beta fold hydrolase n=1 Tax=Halanaerobium saccharolyticum TaxID=43595 RepID=UPI003FCD5BCC
MLSIQYNQGFHKINNHRIYCKHCQNGQPTVIFESGLGDDSSTWKEIQDEISSITSTFSYDRAGTGKSESRDGPKSGIDIVQDLTKIVDNRSLGPPYILVGHSFGGLLSRLFASINPENIAGMVLIDAAPVNKEVVFENILTGKQKEQIIKYLKNPSLNSEKVDKIKTYKQILKHKKKFDFPLTIIIRGLAKCYGPNWPEDKLLEIEQELQLDYKQLSENSKTVIAEKSGHYIHKDQPELVINEIKEMVDKLNN